MLLVKASRRKESTARRDDRPATAVRLGPVLGDREGNLALALAAIEDAAATGATLVVLPELATSGYAFADAGEARAAAAVTTA